MSQDEERLRLRTELHEVPGDLMQESSSSWLGCDLDQTRAVNELLSCALMLTLSESVLILSCVQRPGGRSARLLTAWSIENFFVQKLEHAPSQPNASKRWTEVTLTVSLLSKQITWCSCFHYYYLLVVVGGCGGGVRRRGGDLG